MLVSWLLGFGVSEHVRFEIGALGESFVAAGERAHERSIARVNANVRAQVKVKTKLLATTLERTLNKKQKN